MNDEVVVRVLVHCEGCATSLFNILKGYDGVEDIQVDSINGKVIVKGEKIDHMKVFERIRKKYSRNVELIHPKPTNNRNDKKEPETKQQPKIKIVVLKMLMHCQGCEQDIKKDILQMKGVLTVETNMEKSEVTVRGEFDPSNLALMIRKRLHKHVQILRQEQVKEKQEVMDVPIAIKEIPHHYYPRCIQNYICPCEFASDENVFSCFIM